jgi:hypothetical protein
MNDYHAMSVEELRVKCAEARDTLDKAVGDWFTLDGKWLRSPDYPGSLDECWELVEEMGDDFRELYYYGGGGWAVLYEGDCEGIFTRKCETPQRAIMLAYLEWKGQGNE